MTCWKICSKKTIFLTLNTDEDEAQNGGSDDIFQKMKNRIAELAEKVEPVKIRINVRRKLVFKDYLDVAKKSWFNSARMLKVTFVGEPAIDDGGPRREFFSGLYKLLATKLSSSPPSTICPAEYCFFLLLYYLK